MRNWIKLLTYLEHESNIHRLLEIALKEGIVENEEEYRELLHLLEISEIYRVEKDRIEILDREKHRRIIELLEKI
ncbi:MAG: hypothetical protein GXO26_07950 [Crenarchaeota archaeon]|nr:hypothetical protein [Thermoproteota archaeon]